MLQKNTPALTWHQISCKFFACKFSSLGPGAELLPQATEIDQKAFTLYLGEKGAEKVPKSCQNIEIAGPNLDQKSIKN